MKYGQMRMLNAPIVKYINSIQIVEYNNGKLINTDVAWEVYGKLLDNYNAQQTLEI